MIFLRKSRMKFSHSIIILLIIITIADVISNEEATHKQQSDNNMMYNDGNLVVLNDVYIDIEHLGKWNEDIDLNKFIPPPTDTDVKCLMHVDRYCSKPMARIKGLLIRALKHDCENCTIIEKESVGKIVASMWAYYSEYWKLFLTRFDSLDKLERIVG